MQLNTPANGAKSILSKCIRSYQEGVVLVVKLTWCSPPNLMFFED